MATRFPLDSRILWDRTPVASPVTLKYSDVFSYFILTGRDIKTLLTKVHYHSSGESHYYGKILHNTELSPSHQKALATSIFGHSCRYALVMNQENDRPSADPAKLTIPLSCVDCNCNLEDYQLNEPQ
jgi:hypothetical protein